MDTSFSRLKNLLPVLFLFLSALAIRLYFLRFYDVVSSDGVSYITIAKDFIQGRGLSAATHYPPFYPMLVGWASLLFHDFETAGLAVSVAMGSLLVVPVYLLGAEFFDRKVGYAGAILAASWPTLRYWSTAVMTQGTYITLLLFGVYFLWRAYRTNSLALSVLAGALFGCAHLTRSEGVLVFFAEIAVLFAFSATERKLRDFLFVVPGVVAFFLVFSPYAVLLHQLTGKWQLTGKSRIALADALAMYLGEFDLKHSTNFKEIGYLDLFRYYPDYLRSNYLKNVKVCWKEMLPWYGWMFAAIGFLATQWSKQRAWERLYLVATFAPLVVIIVFFFVGPEYTQPYLPVLLLFIGNGLRQPLNWGLGRLQSARMPARLPDVCSVLVLVIALVYAGWNVVREVPKDAGTPYNYMKDEGRFDEKRIGIRLRTIIPPDSAIMTRSGRIGFYSDRRYVTPPQASYEEIVDFARKNKIGYFIATLQILKMRPQLSFLFGPLFDPKLHFVLPPELSDYLGPGMRFAVPPELELVHGGQEPGGLPYLVYRFRFR